MAFWSEDFMQRRREEWARDISGVEYRAGSTWYKGQITEKKLVGDKLSIRFVTTDSLLLTINEIRLLDSNGKVAGSTTENVVKSATQGMLYAIECTIIESVKRNN